MEILDFDILSNWNIEQQQQKNQGKNLIKTENIISYRYILSFVSTAHFSTNFANIENVPCSFSKLPVVFLVWMQLKFYSWAGMGFSQKSKFWTSD